MLFAAGDFSQATQHHIRYYDIDTNGILKQDMMNFLVQWQQGIDNEARLGKAEYVRGSIEIRKVIDLINQRMFQGNNQAPSGSPSYQSSMPQQSYSSGPQPQIAPEIIGTWQEGEAMGFGGIGTRRTTVLTFNLDGTYNIVRQIVSNDMFDMNPIVRDSGRFAMTRQLITFYPNGPTAQMEIPNTGFLQKFASMPSTFDHLLSGSAPYELVVNGAGSGTLTLLFPTGRFESYNKVRATY